MLCSKTELLTIDGWTPVGLIAPGEQIAVVKYQHPDQESKHPIGSMIYAPLKGTTSRERDLLHVCGKGFEFCVYGDIPCVGHHGRPTEIGTGDLYAKLYDKQGTHCYILNNFKSMLGPVTEPEWAAYILSLYQTPGSRVRLRLTSADDKKLFFDNIGNYAHQVLPMNDKGVTEAYMERPANLRWPVMSQDQLERSFRLAVQVHGREVGPQSTQIDGLTHHDADFLQFAACVSNAQTTSYRGPSLMFQPGMKQPFMLHSKGCRSRVVRGEAYSVLVDAPMVLTRYNYHITAQATG